MYEHPISTTPLSSDVPFLSSVHYPSLFTDAGCSATHAMHTGCPLCNSCSSKQLVLSTHLVQPATSHINDYTVYSRQKEILSEQISVRKKRVLVLFPRYIRLFVEHREFSGAFFCETTENNRIPGSRSSLKRNRFLFVSLLKISLKNL